MDAFTDAGPTLNGADSNIVRLDEVRGKPLTGPEQRFVSTITFLVGKEAAAHARRQNVIDGLLSDPNAKIRLEAAAENLLAMTLQVLPEAAEALSREEMMAIIKGHLTGEAPLT